jgi:hypothetical protein
MLSIHAIFIHVLRIIQLLLSLDLGVKKEPQILRGAEDRLNDSNLISFRNMAYIFVGFTGIFIFYKGYINRNRMLSNCRKQKQSV